MRQNVAKNRTLIIVAFVLIAVIAIALVVTMVKLNSTITTKNLSFTAYEIGSIDDSGENYSSTASIRTKNYILVDGLNCDLKQDASVTYKVFFYDSKEVLLTKTDAQSGDYSTIPDSAKYFRGVITPNSDAEVSLTELIGYANQLTVTVNR